MLERFEIKNLEWEVPKYSLTSASKNQPGNLTFNFQSGQVELSVDATLTDQSCGELVEALAEEISSNIDSDIYLFTYDSAFKTYVHPQRTPTKYANSPYRSRADIFLIDKQLLVNVSESELRISKMSLYSRTDQFVDDAHKTQMRFVRALAFDETINLYDPNSIPDLLALAQTFGEPKCVADGVWEL